MSFFGSGDQCLPSANSGNYRRGVITLKDRREALSDERMIASYDCPNQRHTSGFPKISNRDESINGLRLNCTQISLYCKQNCSLIHNNSLD